MSPRAKKLAAWTAAALVLAAVFALYTRPGMMVTVGNMVLACFQ